MNAVEESGGAKQFVGKTVLVTGAASGIGRGAVLAFARHGANVVLADIAQEAGEAVAAQIRSDGGQAIFQRADVVNALDVEALVATAVREFGRLDCAFNNAGIEEEHERLADSDEALPSRPRL